MDEFSEKFMYDILTSYTSDRMKAFLASEFQREYPLVETKEYFFIDPSGGIVNVTISEIFIKELSEKYPEAVI